MLVTTNKTTKHNTEREKKEQSVVQKTHISMLENSLAYIVINKLLKY